MDVVAKGATILTGRLVFISYCSLPLRGHKSTKGVLTQVEVHRQRHLVWLRLTAMNGQVLQLPFLPRTQSRPAYKIHRLHKL